MRHDSVIPSFLLERATSDCATISRHLVFERLRSVVLWPNGAESLSLPLSRSPPTFPLGGENCRAKETRGERQAKWRRTGRIG